MKFHSITLPFLLMVVSAMLSGCASNPPSVFSEGGPVVLWPKLTSVITGPVGLLLTNRNAFSSKFSMAFEEDLEHPVSGQILVRGGNIRLEAAFATKNKTSTATGDFGLIWDAASNQGYVFSEALQGYASLDNTVRYTNILNQVVISPMERMEGHPVDTANVTVMCSDGKKMAFRLIRAQDAGGLPIQTKSLNSVPAFTMTLSQIRLENLSEDLFLRPEGFTKYESEMAMLTELGIRQQGVLFGKTKDTGVNINYKTPGEAGQN